MEDRSSRSKNKRHSGECHRSCECSEPLTGYRPNIENDHSRE
jgi:hypothetical protein